MKNRLLEKFPDTRIWQAPDGIRTRPLSSANYLMCITPRSGSTWLGDLLRRTGVMGSPREWLNPNSIESSNWCLKARSLHEYMDGIRRQHSTDNGVFGVQVGYYHLKFALEAASLEQLFGRAPVWFYLRRENFIRQGISLYLSTESGYWHAHQHGEKERRLYDAVTYDPDKIEHWCRHIIRQEVRFEAVFGECRTEPVRLIYEDVARDPRRATRLMTNVMGVRSAHVEDEAESSVGIISDERNSSWETRFRTERSAVVEELSGARLERSDC